MPTNGPFDTGFRREVLEILRTLDVTLGSILIVFATLSLNGLTNQIPLRFG